jgi:ribonuclease J
MITMTRPRYFIPIHGDIRQLYSHARLAENTGMPRERILLAESGDVIEISGRQGRVNGTVPVGRVFIDGGFDEVDEIVVRDRRHISAGGVVLAIVAIDQQSGRLIGRPEIVSRGFVFEEASGALLRDAANVVRDSVQSATPEERSDRGFIKALIQRDLKRFFRKRVDQRPMIIPAVVET